ncbi:MAG: class I SAM-dependent methyltransferase [Actinobacteria bacterium]|nr:class I SAM-dependent methyltransferase [Actinomycetota bacterium]
MTGESRGPAVGYLHGYATPEQERLVAQAEHWRESLILDGTRLEPGTRLLEVGCGVGAVLAVLSDAFPRLQVSGVDIEPRQLEFAGGHLARAGAIADLRVADGRALPYADAAFDHVWMMWFLEHLRDPLPALREARRVLAPGGRITAIEADYSTAWTSPSTPATEALLSALVAGMAASGRSDAGTHVARWLGEAGFAAVDPGERVCSYDGEEAGRQVRYVADVIDGVIPSLAALSETGTEDELRSGLTELRALSTRADLQIGWVIHKARGSV